MNHYIRSVGFGVLAASVFSLTGCAGTAGGGEGSDPSAGSSDSASASTAAVAPEGTLTDEQRSEVQAHIDPAAAAALAERFRTNPESFPEVTCPATAAQISKAPSAENVAQTSQAISWSCRLANYGNPIWWQLVASIAAVRSVSGLTWANCNWVVDHTADLAAWYGLPFVPFAGWSGRCACTYVYE